MEQCNKAYVESYIGHVSHQSTSKKIMSYKEQQQTTPKGDPSLPLHNGIIAPGE